MQVFMPSASAITVVHFTSQVAAAQFQEEIKIHGSRARSEAYMVDRRLVSNLLVQVIHFQHCILLFCFFLSFGPSNSFSTLHPFFLFLFTCSPVFGSH